jgi:hypothetical protein
LLALQNLTGILMSDQETGGICMNRWTLHAAFLSCIVQLFGLTGCKLASVQG